MAGLALPGLCIGAAALQADFWTRLALPAASNAINILSGSAAFASLPALVGPIRIERANSLMAIGPSLAYMVGPTFSDWLFDIVRASLRLGVNAGTAAILAATALVPVLPVARPETTDAVAWSPWGGVRSGWRAIRSAPVVAAAMSLLVLPMVGTQRLARRTTFLIVGGRLCLAVAILTEGLVPIAIVIGAAFVMGGLGNGTHNVGVRNLIFEQTPVTFLVAPPPDSLRKDWGCWPVGPGMIHSPCSSMIRGVLSPGPKGTKDIADRGRIRTSHHPSNCRS